jgi:hypothetical protein
MSSDTELTAEELYTIASEVDIEGRSSMNKEELREALADEAPHLLNPFEVISDLAIGDQVTMNHLSSVLTVTTVIRYDGETKSVIDDEVHQEDSDVSPHTVVVMRTSRGGRHALVCQKETPNGPRPWKNADEPHLRRWRAGDQEWMNNSDDPVFIRRLDEE